MITKDRDRSTLRTLFAARRSNMAAAAAAAAPAAAAACMPLLRGAAVARELCSLTGPAAWAAAARGGTPAALECLRRPRAGPGAPCGPRGVHSSAAAGGEGDQQQPSPSGGSGGAGDGGFETVYEVCGRAPRRRGGLYTSNLRRRRSRRSSVAGPPTALSPARAAPTAPHPPLQGLFAANHKRLKLASLVNTAVSLAACPAIVLLSDAPPLARAAVAVGVVGFGLGTTLGLHWFTSPYVHVLARRGDVLRARTLTLLGRPRWSEFSLEEVRHPDSLRPLASFKVGLWGVWGSAPLAVLRPSCEDARPNNVACAAVGRRRKWGRASIRAHAARQGSGRTKAREHRHRLQRPPRPPLPPPTRPGAGALLLRRPRRRGGRGAGRRAVAPQCGRGGGAGGAGGGGGRGRGGGGGRGGGEAGEVTWLPL